MLCYLFDAWRYVCTSRLLQCELKLTFFLICGIKREFSPDLQEKLLALKENFFCQQHIRNQDIPKTQLSKKGILELFCLSLRENNSDLQTDGC